MKHNTALTSLDVSDNNIDAGGGKVLAEVLKSNSCRLSQLNLYRNKLGDEGATAIAESLRHNRSLQFLFLTTNRIGDNGAIALAQAMEVNKTLRSVNISRNRYGYKGATALVEALKFNSTLQEFDISYQKDKPELQYMITTQLKKPQKTREQERLEAIMKLPFYSRKGFELDTVWETESLTVMSAAVIAKHLTSEKALLLRRLLPEELVDLCQNYVTVVNPVPEEPEEKRCCLS
eukprot:TRINITY_DN5544_c0_g1_i2.p1 TRINITY_DN5544_c0_g1~~TRINITY_DN5544_c0_g1_i2.p1  ORF type:complete len:234 (-),score=59.81 TRINITY_DN5544_c0_g1_i2:136-837(-)